MIAFNYSQGVSTYALSLLPLLVSINPIPNIEVNEAIPLSAIVTGGNTANYAYNWVANIGVLDSPSLESPTYTAPSTPQAVSLVLTINDTNSVVSSLPVTFQVVPVNSQAVAATWANLDNRSTLWADDDKNLFS